MQPTLPKIPPIIVAAIAIPNNLKAPELYSHLKSVLYGLIDHGIKIVSYACDGTETERSVQELVVSHADAVLHYTIPHPLPDQPSHVIRIPMIHGQPVIMVQDSKHAAKTYRNNLYSGARLLLFGNHTPLYSQVRKLAFEPDAPLYRRDVEKVDRQDDNAATRLFSSVHLDFILQKQPTYIGLLVYLFIFAEVVNIYQNRDGALTLQERVKIALRTRYFLDIWRAYLQKAGYPEARYCLSREAIDITRIIIDGFVGLLIVHRDHLEDVFPFVPWLHSTEACEHIFGECRKLVEDFTYLDFIYMVPRLLILVRAACQSGKTGDPRGRAGGYAHTYFDSGKIDITVLSTFPSDDDIKVAAKEAWEEAANLWDLLGVTPSDILASEANPGVRLPSASSWFVPGDDPVYDYDEDELAACDFGAEDGEEVSAADILRDALERDRHAPSLSAATESRLEAITVASIALAMGDMCQA